MSVTGEWRSNWPLQSNSVRSNTQGILIPRFWHSESCRGDGDGDGNGAYPQDASLSYLSATHVENPGRFQARYYNDTSSAYTEINFSTSIAPIHQCLAFHPCDISSSNDFHLLLDVIPCYVHHVYWLILISMSPFSSHMTMGNCPISEIAQTVSPPVDE
ncbi:hypothetical protein COCSADRAFT_313875 [Bipolaris sorokiniana ND90Pr]|uniref:Uncharacterized protein n=1 Tax=Cochliobolus sativus (strain ND90Pr / ATCC 201652) TaxID=665912 RepID=M2SR06_COCSN|nr:uncharacterized protein COCSADRAFT_313875 [Bipolaris sorokiniana ND90Pr]EMD64720.1 hypothetical protein COCSADRAFT_313875 [Bipolaris sorokiniana ND90Pr]